MVSRFGEGTLGAGITAEDAGVFVGRVELDSFGGEDFDSRPHANKSNVAIASGTR